MSVMRKLMADVCAPFCNKLLVVAIGVSGVPEGTPRLVNGIQNLRYKRGSANHRNDERHVCWLPSDVPRPCR